MINNMNIFLINIFLIFFSCQSKKNEGNYILYKYFDEYDLKGVNKIDNIENYNGKFYVSVLVAKDSIILHKMKKNKIIEKLVYFKKKGSWELNFREENFGNDKSFKGITYYHKKIIENDTIYNYSYNLINGKYTNGCLSYTTKQKSIFCYDCGIDIVENKLDIKYAKQYLKKCNNKEVFYKKYIGDRMFTYYEDGTLFDVGSFCFGYFDSDEKNNESFIDEYQ